MTKHINLFVKVKFIVFRETVFNQVKYLQVESYIFFS